MTSNIEALREALQQAFPTSHVRLLPEPAMFLRSNLGEPIMPKACNSFPSNQPWPTPGPT